MRTLVLDNGSYTIKCGYVEEGAPALTIPNAVTRTKRTKRVYVGDLIDTSTDLSGLYYRSPFERGYLVHWDVQLAVWDRVLSASVLGCTPSETALLLTEPMFNFHQIQQSTDEIVFEEYGFASLARAPAPMLAAAGAGELIYGGLNAPECVLVVDIGHAFTHIVPYRDGRQISTGVRRVNVGGRLLTNYLKETVSFRYWDMMDETYIMSSVKEKCCFVSQDFSRDLERSKKNNDNKEGCVEYVLPDFTTSKRGFIRGQGSEEEERGMLGSQVLPLCNERFVVPDALFHPSDLGIEQAGIDEAVVHAVSACPSETHGVLLGNVIVVGGTARLPGLLGRLQRDVQARVAHRVRVFGPDDPASWAWQCGNHAVQERSGWQITRAMYEEMGAQRTIAHFDSFI
ncbi:Actin- protein 6 [Coemansia erecta]|nr:Actin- protein 6 [Coemansia erecta]